MLGVPSPGKQVIHRTYLRGLYRCFLYVSYLSKMIETGCFEDINASETDGTVSPDRERSPKTKRGFFHRLFSGEVRVFLFFHKKININSIFYIIL